MGCDMKSYRQLAINELFFNGIGVTSDDFEKLIREYNNFEMSLNDRCRSIAEKKDTRFIEFVKNKLKIN